MVSPQNSSGGVGKPKKRISWNCLKEKHVVFFAKLVIFIVAPIGCWLYEMFEASTVFWIVLVSTEMGWTSPGTWCYRRYQVEQPTLGLTNTPMSQMTTIDLDPLARLNSTGGVGVYAGGSMLGLVRSPTWQSQQNWTMDLIKTKNSTDFIETNKLNKHFFFLIVWTTQKGAVHFVQRSDCPRWRSVRQFCHPIPWPFGKHLAGRSGTLPDASLGSLADATGGPGAYVFTFDNPEEILEWFKTWINWCLYPLIYIYIYPLTHPLKKPLIHPLTFFDILSFFNELTSHCLMLLINVNHVFLSVLVPFSAVSGRCVDQAAFVENRFSKNWPHKICRRRMWMTVNVL